MNVSDFLTYVERGKIPPEGPNGISPGGWGYMVNDSFGKRFMDSHQARDKCIKYGMWAIVALDWTKMLADWIGNRKVLEIMAGAGWLAKALNQHGVTITATDDYSWDGSNAHAKMKRVYEVQKMHCLEAIIKIPADILLVSWPPYEDETITAACRLWGKKKPVVYLGESEGGCNAPNSFWQGFKLVDNQPDIPMPSWDGVHDYVHIGYWKG